MSSIVGAPAFSGAVVGILLRGTWDLASRAGLGSCHHGAAVAIIGHLGAFGAGRDTGVGQLAGIAVRVPRAEILALGAGHGTLGSTGLAPGADDRLEAGGGNGAERKVCMHRSRAGGLSVLTGTGKGTVPRILHCHTGPHVALADGVDPGGAELGVRSAWWGRGALRGRS